MGEITPNEISSVVRSSDCIYSESEVELAIDNLANLIAAQVATKNPILLCAMNGGLIVTGKLATRLQFPLQIDYVHATRYRGNTSGADLQWKNYPSLDMKGRAIIIIDDVFDEGFTLESLVNFCHEKQAADVLTTVLVNKVHDRKKTSLTVDFVGLETGDRYLYGYGMDYKGFLRNAAGIYAVSNEDS